MNKKTIILLIVVTFALKMGLAFYFTYLADCQSTEKKFSYFASAVDSFSTIEPIDNLIKEGEYYFWNGTRKVYAGRMPYYGVPYFVFRQFFSQSVSGDLFVIYQILADSLAAVFFGLLCFNILQKKSAFWVGWLAYFLNFNLFALNFLFAPEILSMTYFVFFLYFFHQYWTQSKSKDAIISSIFLALVTTLKPYFVVIYLPFLLGLLYKEKDVILPKFKYFVRQSLIAGLPLLLLLLPWTIRNAITLGAFIPTQESLTAGYNYTDADLALRKFVGAWGGDFIYWEPKAAGCYFQLNPPAPCTFTMPDYAIVDGYTAEDVEKVRQDYFQLQRQFTPELNQSITSELNRLTDIYKSQNPFMYHIGSRLMTTKSMLWTTNNYLLPIHPSYKCYRSYQLLFKLLQFAIYVLGMSLGVLGIVKLSFERKISLVFISIPIFLLCFFAILRFTEPRYFTHGYLIFLLGLTGLAVWIIEKIRPSKSQESFQ